MSNIMITTASTFDGYDIKDYVEFLSHEVVFRSNFAQEIAASVSDAVGGEGRDISDKLEEATEQALKEFSSIAEEKGANAIINTKINYTNLSGSVAAVFISGTAVKIARKEGTLKRDVKVLAVSNYVNKKIVRPFEVALHVDGTQTFMSLKLHNYEMTKITAVKVDVTFTDVYGETTTLENVDYVMNNDINILIATDMVPVDFDVRKVGLQTDVKVTVRKYIKDRVVYDVTEPMIDSSLNSDELEIFKKNKGADAVDKYRKTDTYWRCVCGAINLPGDTQCTMCNREEKDFGNGFNFDYEGMLSEMRTARSSKDIKDIYMTYNKDVDAGSRVEILEILQSAINMEESRGEGAMKASVLEKLKRKFELS